MSSYITFLKKEFMEYSRNYKFLIIVIVFLIFGMMSPLLAKMMPDLMGMFEVEGVKIEFPTPTIIDAYSQFFKNINQTAIIIFVLVFCTALSNELSKGTLINILSKGFARKKIVLAKFTAITIIWTAALIIASLANSFYATFLFPDSSVQNLFISIFSIWIFGLFLISLILLSSILFNGNLSGIILPFTIMVLLMLLNIFPIFKEWNPILLVSSNVDLITGQMKAMEIIKTNIITSTLIIFSLITTILKFNKKSL